MKYLIFGGAGFLGTHMKNYLRKHGHIVYIMDNMVSGEYDNATDPYYYDCDINSRCIPRLETYDYIINMASIASPFYYRDMGIDTLRAGAGVDDICRIALERKAPLLHISTAKLYDFNAKTADSYDVSKLYAEQIIKEYRKRGLYAKIARLHNVYGPGMRINDGRVVPQFIKKALGDETITITSNPEFSITYIDDMIKALDSFMHGGIETVELGNDRMVTIHNLAKMVIKLCKSESRIEFKDGGYPGIRRPDLTIAKDKLNWKPTTKLEDGLVVMIKDFKRRNKCIS